MNPMIGVDDDDRDDDRGVDPVLHERRDEGGGEQHINQYVMELQREAHERAAPPAGRKAIGAMDGEPPFCLSLAQAQTRHAQALKRRIGSDRPIFLSFRRRLHA